MGYTFFLLTRSHSGRRARAKALLHFSEGVYAAGVLRDARARHIHAHFVDRAAIVALVASRLLDGSYSVTAHANDIFVEPLLLSEKLCHAKFVVTVSQYNKMHLLAQVPELNPDRLHIIPPQPNLARFVPTRRAGDGACHILSVGRLVEQKGHADLIRACARLRDEQVAFDCHIVGDGPLRAALENLIRENGLDDCITLLGAQTAEQVLREYQRADVFVLACTIGADGSRDGMPCALQEAMAMELPVISTSVVGIRELVQPGAGVLVPPNDPCALADAFKRVLAIDADARRVMGRIARQVVLEQFAGAQQLARLAEHFRAAILRC